MDGAVSRFFFIFLSFFFNCLFDIVLLFLFLRLPGDRFERGSGATKNTALSSENRCKRSDSQREENSGKGFLHICSFIMRLEFSTSATNNGSDLHGNNGLWNVSKPSCKTIECRPKSKICIHKNRKDFLFV